MQQQWSFAMLPNDNHLLTRQAIVKNGNGHKARRRRPPPNATECALLAYGLFSGRLTAQQSCRLAGANHAYFALVAAMNDAERNALAHGKLLLADIVNAKAKARRNGSNGNGGHSDESLIERLRRADAAELVAAVREFGVGKFFDVAIVPTLDQGATEVVVDQA
jgi:hypothetical protein